MGSHIPSTRVSICIRHLVIDHQPYTSISSAGSRGLLLLVHDLRRALSHSWLLFLGQISFPLYLLHGSFMRSTLAWLLFAQQDLKRVEDDGKQYMRYPQPGLLTFAIVLPIFFATLLSTSYAWAVKVEPWFGWIARKAEDVMFGKDYRSHILPSKQW